MSLRTLLAPFIGLILVATFVPAFALADTCNTGWNWGWNQSSNTCNDGKLLVYVQVSNANNGITRTSSDFTVSVQAANPSVTAFPGSLSGTNVSFKGVYSVNVLPMQGYSASYSAGCTGNLGNNESAMCIVTMGATNYANYPYTYYPNQYNPNTPYYPGYVAPLTCAPNNQTVTVGQSITFTATGGEFSQFNWSNSAVSNNTKYNIGRNFTTTLYSPGVQTVTVFNGQQSASCTVTVVGYPIPGYSYGPTGMPVVTVTPTFIPRFPNTGLDPQTGAALAFVVVLLGAAALVVYPYVRSALTSIYKA